ncbi:SLC39A10 [Branchiostoma lanceolatum]|uniref:SLC39A10 protein n=2 Tax=Branchiostoma lanceolatum TaxID=7740 RepID=A0A8K0EK35_BRALA|nr:SLC39A10 [Branchiostoma lanceolatum]
MIRLTNSVIVAMNRAPLHCVCVCFLCLLTFGLFHQAEAASHSEGFDPVSVTARNAYHESLKENEFLQKIFKKYGKDGKMTFDGFQELLERLGLGEVRIVHHEEVVVDHKADGNSSTNITLVVDTVGDKDHVHYPHTDGHHTDHDGEDDDEHEESGAGHSDHDHSGHLHHEDSHESALPGKGHSDDDHDDDHHHHEDTTEIIKQVPQNPATAAPEPAAIQEAPTPRPLRQGGSRRQRRKGKRRQRGQRGRKSTAAPTVSSLDLMEITTESDHRRARRDASTAGNEDDEHHDGHDHDDHDHDDHDHDNHDHDNHDHDDHEDEEEHVHPEHGHGHEHDQDHNQEDHDHEHDDHEDHDHEHGDHDHDKHEDHDHRDHEPGAHCLSAKEILVEYNIPAGPSIMMMPDFVNICPLLITQIDEQACIVHEEDVHDHGEHGKHKAEGLPAAVWGYGILAVTVISILAVLGIVLLPFMEQRVYQFLLCFLVALAVGTLTGDAVLHLLPHALGLHAHADEDGHEGHEDHGGHDEGHDDGGSHLDPVLKGLTVLFGIYFLFIMEKLMGVMTKRRAKRKAKKLRKQRELAHPGESYELKASTDSPTEDDHCHHHHHHHHHDNEKLKDAGIATMAWMVIMGDGLHNFSDGMAIGAAFASGIPGGVSTSVAVFCHELPHELGDFALLIRAGMSAKQAILYNLMSACICYIGLLIGLGIGNLSGNVIQYVFAVTAGMFLYVGLVDMLPDMVHPNQPQVIAEHDHGENNHGELGHGHGHSHGHMDEKKKKNDQGPANPVLVQSFGLLVGIGIMLLIAVFEDQIKI